MMVGATKWHTFNLPSVFVTCDGKYTPLETEVPASLGQFATNQLVLSVISEHSEANPVVAAAAGLGAACAKPAMKPKRAVSFWCCIVTLIWFKWFACKAKVNFRGLQWQRTLVIHSRKAVLLEYLEWGFLKVEWRRDLRF